MQDLAVPSQVRLRLDRHQRAREEGVPTVSVLIGDRSVGRAWWERWLESRARPAAWVSTSEASAEPLARRIAAAILAGRRVDRDVAALIALHTGEPLASLEARLPTLGHPERTILLDDVASASRREIAALALALLRAPGEAIESIEGADALATLLELLPPHDAPGLLVEALRVEDGLPLLLRLSERLPAVPVALAVGPAAIDRFLAEAGSPRDRARVSEGSIRLDADAPAPAGSSATVEQLREQLAVLCQQAPADAEAADRARSLAERLLFTALQEHPLTRDRFALNARMPFSFGPRAAEVDLFSARDRVAIEIDGYHHFVDADAYRRDRRKDVLLQRHGLFVLRFLAQDVGPRLARIIDRILDILHRPNPPGASA